MEIDFDVHEHDMQRKFKKKNIQNNRNKKQTDFQ